MCVNVFLNGVVFLIPTLDDHAHLAVAALLTSMPRLGTAITLIGWGYLVDRLGERFVLFVGMGVTAAATFAAAAVDSFMAMGALLFLGGMAGAGNTVASGRLVLGWFAHERRGLVMGIRQTASPLGVALAALVIPQLAARYSVSAALMFPALLCALAALLAAIWVRDPPRAAREHAPDTELANPFRGSAVLWRIHAASALLAIPQALVWTFTLVWLIDDHGWSLASAGIIVTIAQLLGAAGRVVAGHWSDHLGARLLPIRIIGLAAAVVMLLLALTAHFSSPLSIILLVAASVITVTDNGLSFIAIAEVAGPYWSGRALGVQYTSLLLTMGGSQPLFGALIVAAGFPTAFATAAFCALIALPVVPVRADSPTTRTFPR